ncbi:acyl-CoA dehydrogenase [Nocardioides ferulae]|uniref:acyl-CoA dehydrogenase n=1 Tax=Nocardioides ferulae TaxID=2340821 RepID=UPI000EAF7D04|nr:acyl-CoA dehydrogenase [Nocardioides ferulae]
MSIGISEEHVELAASLRKWAAAAAGAAAARDAENDPETGFGQVWKGVVEMGLPGIGLPEAVGGGGGSVLDVAVALEACAHELLPGPLLGVTVAGALLGETPGLGERITAGAHLAIGPSPTLRLDGDRLVGTVEIVWDAPAAELLLLGATGEQGERWFVLPGDAAITTPHPVRDLTRRTGSVRVDLPIADTVAVPHLDAELLHRTMVTFAAAEAAGVARWCLQTAVDYAKVREQFGRKIGSFQAVKHLCAEMLETAEAVTAAAFDVANAAFGVDDGGDDQWAFAADVAQVTALDGAVEVAKSCIQVLGGIGFTFEHDAHLYLRRAMTLRGLLGDGDEAALRLAGRAADGVRRRVEVDLEGRDEAVRGEVRASVERIAALPEDQRRAALVDAGYLTPHWPTPYGLSADPVQQLVIDQELARASVTRPDLVIAGWALPTILEHGTPEQQERFVRPSLLGELVWCQLFSEPGSGSDLASLRTRAERVEGGWRLTGQKVWTSVADRADWAICLARTDADAPQHRGISYFLVDMRSEGIDVRPLREITGEALFNEVFLDEVFVPDDCLVGGLNEGWKLARTTLANERVAMATSRLDKSTERAVSLAARGGLSDAQLVRVGRAVALSTVCTLLGVRTTLRSLAGRGPGAESSVAKLLGVRNRQDGSELVVRLLEERLVADGDEVREAVWEMLNTRCLSIAGGTTQVLRNVAGERILGLPR